MDKLLKIITIKLYCKIITAINEIQWIYCAYITKILYNEAKTKNLKIGNLIKI